MSIAPVGPLTQTNVVSLGLVVVYMSASFSLHQQPWAFAVFIFPHGSITESAMGCLSRGSQRFGFEAEFQVVHCMKGQIYSSEFS